MWASYRPRLAHPSALLAATLGFSLALPTALVAQSVPPLESPPARPPQTGPRGEKLVGMSKFHDPAPYDIDEHRGSNNIRRKEFRWMGCRPVHLAHWRRRHGG